MDETLIKKIRQYLAVLPTVGIHASKAVLFGSFAQGRADQDSDIDLIVIAPEFDGQRDAEMIKDLWHATLSQTTASSRSLAASGSGKAAMGGLSSRLPGGRAW